MWCISDCSCCLTVMKSFFKDFSGKNQKQRAFHWTRISVLASIKICSHFTIMQNPNNFSVALDLCINFPLNCCGFQMNKLEKIIVKLWAAATLKGVGPHLSPTPPVVFFFAFSDDFFFFNFCSGEACNSVLQLLPDNLREKD